MVFLDIVYMILAPCLVLCGWLSAYDQKKYIHASLAVLNLLMILYGLFFLWQVMSIVTFIRSVYEPHHSFSEFFKEAYGFVIRSVLVVVLPFLFLFRKLRTNTGLSLLLCVLLWWDRPFFSWNTYHAVFKILNCFSLWCAGYALLWLLKLLPFQSAHVFRSSDRM